MNEIMPAAQSGQGVEKKEPSRSYRCEVTITKDGVTCAYLVKRVRPDNLPDGSARAYTLSKPTGEGYLVREQWDGEWLCDCKGFEGCHHCKHCDWCSAIGLFRGSTEKLEKTLGRGWKLTAESAVRERNEALRELAQVKEELQEAQRMLFGTDPGDAYDQEPTEVLPPPLVEGSPALWNRRNAGPVEVTVVGPAGKEKVRVALPKGTTRVVKKESLSPLHAVCQH